MEWIKAISELIRTFAWPTTVIVLVVMFRKEIRRGIESLAELRFPGGSIMMRKVERLEASIEQRERGFIEAGLPEGPSILKSRSPQGSASASEQFSPQSAPKH